MPQRFSASSKTKMGKKVQCCLRVKRASSSCSSSSSSTETCPAVVAGNLITTNSGTTYIPSVTGNLTKQTTGFSISGQEVQLYYVTPAACGHGVAIGEVQYGTLYLVQNAPSGSSSNYVLRTAIVAETTGITPQAFQVKLDHHERLLFIPQGASEIAGSSVFIFSYYPKCVPTPVCPLQAPIYM